MNENDKVGFTVCTVCGEVRKEGEIHQCSGTVKRGVTVSLEANSDIKEAQELLNDLRATASKQSGEDYSKKSFAETREYLKDAQKSEAERKLNAERGTSMGGAQGKATLTSYASDNGDVKEYDSYEKMLEDVNERCLSEDEAVRNEAKAIKEQLEEKMFLTEKGELRKFDEEIKSFDVNEFWEQEKKDRPRRLKPKKDIGDSA